MVAVSRRNARGGPSGILTKFTHIEHAGASATRATGIS